MSGNKPVLIALHGMGAHTKESFQNEITSELDKAIKQFSFKDKQKLDFTSRANLEIVTYDQNFNKIRERLQKGGSDLSKLLKGLPSKDGIYKVLSKMDVNFAKNSFFNTHWLDVVLYKEYWGEWVRNTVAEQLVRLMLKYSTAQNPHDVHLMGHSLGTAVLHDTLSELFTKDINGKDGIENKSNGGLSAQHFKFDSIYMIANVSRLIQGSKHPYESIVKPEGGICEYFANIFHKLDPITWPKKFDPRHDKEGWVSSMTYQLGFYSDIELEAITHYNTHAITHYLGNPKVYLDIFRSLFGSSFVPTESEIKKANTAFKNKTLKGASKKLGKAFKDTSIKDIESIERLAKELNEFDKLIKAMTKE